MCESVPTNVSGKATVAPFTVRVVTTGDRYFTRQILSCLHDREAFIDGGAHHGAVSTRFAQIVKGRYEAIWAIEPDAKNLCRLRAQLEIMPGDDDVERVHVFSCALGERAGRQRFIDGLGYASQLWEFGDRLVEVRPIDQLNVAPTFIKLHLEGGELAALKGALKTIEQYRPLVVATTYHNRLGLWETPDWAMNHLPEYVFLLRLHGWCGTGSVIYCIPKERYHGVAERR